MRKVHHSGLCGLNLFLYVRASVRLEWLGGSMVGCLCHQAVELGTSQGVVMLCNRSSGMAYFTDLVMPSRTGSVISTGTWAPNLCSGWDMAHFTLFSVTLS